MSHVLQRQDMDQELELVEGKGGGGAVLGKVGSRDYYHEPRAPAAGYGPGAGAGGGQVRGRGPWQGRTKSNED